MFSRQHFDYLSDTILNDPDITESSRAIMYTALEVWFKRDFVNFNAERWRQKWIDRFH